jgi:hypothetical protein
VKPYRYARIRCTSLCVRADDVLTQYLGELAEHIIGECINPYRSDAEVVAGLPALGSAAERGGLPVDLCSKDVLGFDYSSPALSTVR